MSTDFSENLYCIEQIKIPVTFPNILKIYAKAAIRTQPLDLLRWTSSYFHALAKGQPPPVKERFEYLPFTHPTGITPGYLRTLLNQFDRSSCNYESSSRIKVAFKTLFKRWQGIGLSSDLLYQILMIGRLLHTHNNKEIDLYRFLAVACGLLANNLRDTLILVCELFTDEPKGGSAMIPLRTMLSLYGYLAKLDCSGINPMLTNIKTSEFSQISSSFCDSDLLSTFNSRDTEITCTCEENKAETNLSDDMKLYSPEEITVDSDSLEEDDDDDKTRSSCSARLSIKIDKKSSTKIPENNYENEDYNNGIEHEEFTNFEEVTPTYNHDDNEQTTSSVDTMVFVDSKNTLENQDDEDNFIEENNTANDKSFESSFQHDNINEEIKESVAAAKSQINGDEINEVEGKINQTSSGVEIILPKKNFNNDTVNLEESCECCKCGINLSRTSVVKDDIIETSTIESSSSSSMSLENFFNINQKVNYNVPGIGPIVSDEHITRVKIWLIECAQRQQNLVGPRNFRHFLCPDLQGTENL
ncbi:uncharacterized protein LOC122848310 [Aphidius gifuensis]|uniref:uncharacterized protein LOC122848310 n=1 Tax=Aphidius gifuensis TaxID=684658 RepID=UPI001CDBE53C|nr:uncharacterized protein LOC122848310 [Aphidius gifuensis]